MNTKHIAIEVSRDEHYKSEYLKNLKESWPSMAKDYRHYCHNEHPETGEMWVWTSPEGQKFYHLILDQEAGDKHQHETRLQAFKKAIKKTKKDAEAEKIETIEFPKGAFQFNKEELAAAQEIASETLSEVNIKAIFN